MDHPLKLTARGHAVCSLMADLGLSLDAACSRVETELETLRQRVDSILTENDWADLPRAVQAALESVSSCVQDAYLEESALVSMDSVPLSARWHVGADIH
jgi:hypothetical protein